MTDYVIRVLIVDDIPETRENIKKLLAFEPEIEVVGTGANGVEGVELAVALRPDIILMDINMPEMDGITATYEISHLVPLAGVIIISVQTELEYVRRAGRAGARDFLGKPVGTDVLVDAITRVYHEMRGGF